MNISPDMIDRANDCRSISGAGCFLVGAHDEATIKIYIGNRFPGKYLRLCSYQVKHAFDYGWVKNEGDQLQLVSNNDVVGLPARQEKNCKQCSRLNDVGVKSCWCCGCDKPC